MTPKKKPEDLQKRGRKSDFREEYVDKVYSMTLLGLTDIQMAGVLEVSEKTFNSWKKKYPEFLQSLKGKNEADSKVAKSLFSRAIGYDYDEITVEKKGRKVLKTTTTKKQMAPDTTAQIFWLKNRQPELWRDKQFNELTGKDGESLMPTVIVLPAKNKPENDENSNQGA